MAEPAHIAEFLARGGRIEVLPPAPNEFPTDKTGSDPRCAARPVPVDDFEAPALSDEEE